MKTTSRKWSPKRVARARNGISPKALKGKLVRIGNSRGIRLPKTVIEQAGLTTNVEIAVDENQIVIRSAGQDAPRAGWEEQIKKALMEDGDDFDQDWLNAPLPSKFDEKEWTW
jgi:antitoxin MazE